MVNGVAKIVGGHRDRLAVVYLRQSSMAQVREHAESTMRQYGLVEEAVRLGWAREAVVVIDTDLGVSGRWGVARAGFAELVSTARLRGLSRCGPTHTGWRGCSQPSTPD